jgi:hypothetical protein
MFLVGHIPAGGVFQDLSQLIHIDLLQPLTEFGREWGVGSKAELFELLASPLFSHA